MSSGSWPNFSGMLSGVFWGAGQAYETSCGLIGLVIGPDIGGQPPAYALTDFTSFYPKFNGVVPNVVVQAYINLAVASLPINIWGAAWPIAVGWFVAHYCTLYAETDGQTMFTALTNVMHGEAPEGSGTATSTLTLSSAPVAGLQSLTKNGMFLSPTSDYTLTGDVVTLIVPALTTDSFYAIWLLQQYVNTATQPTAAMVAAQGVANGILTSKSVGDVSAGYGVLVSLEAWGAWNLTKYGQQLATMAKTVGSGPALVW